MSKIIEKQEIKEFKNIELGLKCDCCGKEVKRIIDERGYTTNYKELKEFQSFYTRHEDWGNDSHESYEDYDVCSAECFVKLFQTNIQKEFIGSNTGQISELKIDFMKELIKRIQS